MQSRYNGKSIVEYYSEESPEATEFRRLYSKIRHLNPDRNMKNFLITSATVGEGKSTVAAFLAITISKYRDTNTLLIDCDLRRPKIHRLFRLAQERGMAEALLERLPLQSCIKESPLKNLKIMTSGVVENSPAELLNSLRIKDVFAEIKFYFDTIVVDCAPIIPVSDPLVLSPEMDGILLVVKAGKTPKEVVKRAVDSMRDIGVNIIGVVLNNKERVLPYYYDYKYYGYQYYHDYKE